MPTLPAKLQHGQNWKSESIRAINAIIDYLRALRIVGDNQTVSITKKASGITISAKPQSVSKASSSNPPANVEIGQGAAVPCRISTNISSNAWELPYEIIVYPNGYADNTTSVTKYALPTTVGFQPPPPSNEPLISFTNYFLEVGGDAEGGQSAL